MRILPTLAALGLPTLIPSYRNDDGAPATADGYYHLGERGFTWWLQHLIE